MPIEESIISSGQGTSPHPVKLPWLATELKNWFDAGETVCIHKESYGYSFVLVGGLYEMTNEQFEQLKTLVPSLNFKITH